MPFFDLLPLCDLLARSQTLLLFALGVNRINLALEFLRRTLGQLLLLELVQGQSLPMFYSNLFLTFGYFWQTLRGPLSAVSTPNFASKYSFELAICSKKKIEKRDMGRD